jgi:hypothetical protein
MKQILGAFRRTSFGTVAALFLLTAVGVALPARQASAAGLQYRSLQLSSSAPGDVTPVGSGGDAAPEGTAANGQKVSHTYIFQAQDLTAIKALRFQFCNDPFGYVAGCTTPTGFTAASAPSASVSVATAGSFAGGLTWGSASTFTVEPTTPAPTAQQIVIKNSTGATITAGAGQFVKVEFVATSTNFFRNPDALYANGVASPNQSQTFFSHITAYSSDTSFTGGTALDEGTVTSSIANTVSINTRVQETLKFSVGGSGGSADTPSGLASNPTTTCAALDTSGALTMGDNNQSLSAATASNAKSFARLATNSSRGAKILYAGQTLKSTAGDSILALSAQSSSTAGTEQFGLTVLATDGNPVDTVYEDYSALTPATGYNNPAQYNFSTGSNTSPVLLASSTGVVGCDTLPIKYVANISNQTPAGLYSTKVSYIAVPAY